MIRKPETETIKEKSQPGSVLSELICILNWSLLKGDTHCWVIPNSTFSFSLSPFLLPLSSENARNPNGSPHRTAALHTEKQQETHIDGWLFFLLSSSNANGRGGSQVQTTVSCLLCYAGFTLSRPWILPRAHSGEGRGLPELARKAVLSGGNCSRWNIVPTPPKILLSPAPGHRCKALHQGHRSRAQNQGDLWNWLGPFVTIAESTPDHH